MLQDINCSSAAYILPGIPYENIDFHFIKKIVCDIYGISVEMLNYKTRKKEIREPRQVIMFLGHKYLNLTQAECGRLVSKNHSTVLHSSRVVVNQYHLDKVFRKTMHQICTCIGIDILNINALN